MAGRAAVWTTAISASALAPHAAPIALGLAVAKEGFDLLHAYLHRISVLSYIRATPAGSYLSVAASAGVAPGVVLQTASALASLPGDEEGAGQVPAHDEPNRSGVGSDPGEFCIKHRADWLSYAAALARNYQDAEDAVSDVAVKIFNNYDRTGKLCPPKFDDPVAWSKTVIANYIKDRRRRAKVQLKHQAELCPPQDKFDDDVSIRMDNLER